MKTAAYAEPGLQPEAGVSFTPGAAGDDAPPKISIASLLGPVTLSGFGDVYYGYDNNHPYDNLAGLRSFEAPTNGFNFAQGELVMKIEIERVGYETGFPIQVIVKPIPVQLQRKIRVLIENARPAPAAWWG